MTLKTTTAHSFDPVTREYILPIKVYCDDQGNWQLPDNTVMAAPKREAGPLEALRLSASGSAWQVVPDYRRCMLWDKATATPVANGLALGEQPPKGTTHLPPLQVELGAHQRCVWDAKTGAWGLSPDYSSALLYEKASGALAAPLLPGTALPDSLTTTAPPDPAAGPWEFDSATGGWARVQPEPTPEAQPTEAEQ